MDIKNKHALITGAAKRVGKEIALALAGKGAHILLHYNTSKKEAEETARQIRSLAVTCRLLKANLSVSKEIDGMMTAITEMSSPIDILINSASVFYKTPVQKVSESDWDTLIDTNLKAPFLLSKEIGKKMMARQGGKIINIADWSGFRPYKDYAPYCTSKGGLITLTKALARDLSPKVFSNAIAPGPVLLPVDFSEDDKLQIIERTPLRKIGHPQDITNAVVFLLENDYINGTVLVVDGGRSIV